MQENNDKQGRNNLPRPKANPTLIWLVALILLFVFFAFFAPKFSATSLTVDFDDKKVSINTAKIMAPSEGVMPLSQEYYTDSQRGFSLKRLPETEWRSNTARGLDEVLKLKGIVLNGEAKKEQEFGLQTSPLGIMLKEVEVVRFSSGEPLDIKILNDSTNPFIEKVIQNVQQSNQFKRQGLNAEQVNDYRMSIIRSLIGFDRTKFYNELTVFCYNKDALSNVPFKTSLATFSIFVLQSLGAVVNQLTADSRTVFAAGTVGLNNVMINGKKQNLRVDRLWLITENRQYYYIVEIGFSPQTQGSMQVWSDLEKSLKSFTVTP